MDDKVSREEVESMIESAFECELERRVESVLDSLSISIREQKNWEGTKELVIELEYASSGYMGGTKTISSSWPLPEGN